MQSPRKAALAFIFVAMVLDIIAFGIVIPVLPKLNASFVSGDTGRAAEYFGLFGTVWALMQFVFSPVLGATDPRLPFWVAGGLALVNALYGFFVLWAGYVLNWDPKQVGMALAAVGVFSVIVQGGLVRPLVARIGQRRTPAGRRILRDTRPRPLCPELLVGDSSRGDGAYPGAPVLRGFGALWARRADWLARDAHRPVVASRR